MAVELFIPKLGQTVEEVTIVNWLVEDGAKVEQGQAILEVETDKAVFPVEANASGYLHRGPFKESDVVPVVTTVAIIGTPDDKFTVKGGDRVEAAVGSAAEAPASGVSMVEAAPAAPAETGVGERVAVSPRARKLAIEKKVDLSKIKPTGGEGVRIVEQDVLAYLTQLPKASPLAQKVAAESGVDLGVMTGTGPGGRIMKMDVERIVRVETPAPAREVLAPVGEAEVTERIPLSGVRAIIAERMGTSVHTTARVTLVSEGDATEFVTMRERLKERVSEEWGFAPGYNDLLGKIVAI